MDQRELTRIERWFRAYAEGFKQDGIFAARQQIKYDHSFRVADEAEGLAREMEWPVHEICLARAVGILHDVGRFSQYAEFETFVDQKSVNHALRGLEVLRAASVLEGLPGTEQQILEDAIHWHNAKTFPQDLAPDSDRFVRLIRDADKLDGFWIIYDAVAGEKHPKYQDLFIGKSITQPANPELVKTVKEGKLIAYREVQSLADYFILQIGWIYDVNFEVSLKRIRDRKVLENFCLYRPHDQALLEAAAIAQEDLKTRLASGKFIS